jgi:hypothetical protein
MAPGTVWIRSSTWYLHARAGSCTVYKQVRDRSEFREGKQASKLVTRHADSVTRYRHY